MLLMLSVTLEVEMRLLGRRQARYEMLKLRAQRQNEIKENIQRKITNPRSGDRTLTREERRALGRGLGGWDE